MASVSEERKEGSVVTVSSEVCNVKLKGSFELKIEDFLSWCDFSNRMSYTPFKLEFPGLFLDKYVDLKVFKNLNII
jgi:hypothetical protein